MKNNCMEDFINSAKGFIRNPLGVIALFVSLVYAMACLVISQGLPAIENHIERMWLIQFVVWYPVLLLLIFCLLVIFYPLNLYSPKDFKDESLFLRFLSKRQKEKKLEKEVKEMREVKIEKNKAFSLLSFSGTNSKAMTPESVKKFVQMVELKALFWLNEKYNVSFSQDVVIGKGKDRISCDGYAKVDGIDYVVEIKNMPILSKDRLKIVAKPVVDIKSVLDTVSPQHTYKIIACVVYSQKEDGVGQELEDLLLSISANVELVLIDEKELKINSLLME